MSKYGKYFRLSQQIDELQKKWNLLSQKLSKLEEEKILATQSEEKFRLEHHITEIATERQQVVQQLNELERQLELEKGSEQDVLVETNEEQTVTLLIPFVGRETELRQLHQAFTTVNIGKKPNFIFIQGDFGVGKTALVEHFLAELEVNTSSVLIGQGKCAIEKESNGLIPFSQLFKKLIKQGIKQCVVSINMLDFVKEVAPAWLDIFMVGVTGATVKTLESGSNLLGRSMFSQENVFVQFTNAISRLAEKCPVVLFIDDLHWADASSLGLLFHLSRYLQDRAVLVIVTYRPVEAMETGANAALFREIRANLIRYGTLEVEIQQGIDVSGYVAQRYPVNKFLPDLIMHVQELTGGHALFVSQLFSLWEDTGGITSTPNLEGQPIWNFALGMDVQPAVLPTLSEVLEERIRLMEEELGKMLTCASVEGEDFTAQVIARLHKLDESRVFDNLATLEHRYRLIQEQGTKEVDATVIDFFRFAHRFFREHIYHQLSSGKRRLLHKQVGECLEGLYHDNIEEIAGQLALHFREAHEPLKATKYALKAAQFEQSRYAWSECERWCEFGIILLDKLIPGTDTMMLRLDLLEQSGSGYYYSGLYAEAYQKYHMALTIAQKLQPAVKRIANIYERLAYLCFHTAKHSEESLAFIEQCRQILTVHDIPYDETYFRLETTEALIQLSLGNYVVAVQYLREILMKAEDLPPTPRLKSTMADAYDTLAITLRRLNQYPESLVAIQKAIEIAKEVDSKQEAMSLLEMATIHLFLGNLQKSMDCVIKGGEIAKQIGDLDEIVYAQASEGFLLVLLGKPFEAVAKLTEAIVLSERIGSSWNMVYMHADLAMGYLALSNLEMAYQHAKSSLSYAEKILDQFKLGYALDVLAQVEVARQNWESAVQYFNQAIATHKKSVNRHYTARTQRHFAELLIKQGERQKAIELLQTALTTFQELDLEHEIAEAQKFLNIAMPLSS